MPRLLVDLLFYTGTKGGGESYARELYGALGRHESDFEYVGMMSREGYERDHSWFPGDVFNSGISGENRFSWAVGELMRVGTAAKRVGADLIHAPATLGPRKTTVPLVVTLHDMNYWTHPEFMSTPLYTRPVRWMEEQVCRNAHAIITDSCDAKAEITRFLPISPDIVHVVYLAGTPGGAAIDPSRKRDANVILAVGNRLPHKNFISLIRALPLIPESERPSLVITGSRGDDPLRPVVTELGLEEWVTLREWVSDEELRDLHSTATALAVPSLAEGFGLPVVDAMVAGLPVILSDIPVFHEIAGDAGLFFDPRDLKSIATAMRRITADSDLRSALVSRGHKQASSFSWDRTAIETMKIFDLVLDRGGASAPAGGTVTGAPN